ncbi:hypothetical protein BaRGS_00018439 [Batillaria attramentaria]|uniref:Uncharacterized protein n=1 Tax=Batillaria attramentaria TaxID=370345 RepID=A0ABD0KTK7_9CAEN
MNGVSPKESTVLKPINTCHRRGGLQLNSHRTNPGGWVEVELKVGCGAKICFTAYCYWAGRAKCTGYYKHAIEFHENQVCDEQRCLWQTLLHGYLLLSLFFQSAL